MEVPSNNRLGRKTNSVVNQRLYQHQDSANIDIDVRRSRRCEISLALSIASLISISCISSSSTRSGAATAAITIACLSFIITSILTVVGYSSNTRIRDIFITNPIISRTQHDRSLRCKVTFEELGTSIVLVLQCIISGLVLYPRFDTDVMAVAGNDVWNSNLFYSTWFSLYASAHMFSKVLCRNGSHLINAQYHSSMSSPLFMCLFSFTCTATALLIIRSGPACHDKLNSETSYCISALTGGSVSVVCVVVMLLVRTFHLPNVYRLIHYKISLMRINLLMIIGAAIVLIIQCVILGKVTSPSGAGYTIGNAFVTSWMSSLTSLFLLKNVVESSFGAEQPISSLSTKVDRTSTLSTFTDNEIGSDEDKYSCRSIADDCHSIRANQNQVRGSGSNKDSQILQEADAILIKVAELIRRQDPHGLHIDNRVHVNLSKKELNMNSIEPPSSEENSPQIRRSQWQENESSPSSIRLRHQVRKFRAPSPVTSYDPDRSLPQSVPISRNIGEDVKLGNYSAMQKFHQINKNFSCHTPPPHESEALENLVSCTASLPSKSSSNSEKCSVPLDIVFANDDQTSVTEITSNVRATPPSNSSQKRTLSIAVAAALHAAAVSANLGKRPQPKDRDSIIVSNPTKFRDDINQQQGHESLPVSLCSNNMFDGDSDSSLTEGTNTPVQDTLGLGCSNESLNVLTPNGTKVIGILKHKSYTNRNNEGVNVLTPNGTKVIGILKNLPGSSSDGVNVLTPNGTKIDGILSMEGERMEREHPRVSSSRSGSGMNHGLLPRRNTSSMRHFSRTLESRGKSETSMSTLSDLNEHDNYCESRHVVFNC